MWAENLNLYEWTGSLSDELETGDYIRYFADYFQNSAVLDNCFYLALGVGLGVAVLFYYVCCNVSVKFGNIYAWLIALIVCVAATFLATGKLVLGTDGGDNENSTGFYASIYQTRADLGNSGDYEEDKAQDELCEQLIEGLNNGTINVCNEIAMVNMLYAGLFFLVFTFVITKVPAFRKGTIHGKAIPF